MLGYPRLPPKRITIRIKSKSKPGRSDGAYVLLTYPAVFDGNQGMQVGYEKERFIGWVAGKLNGGLDGPENIAQVRTTAALNTGKDASHFFIGQ